MACRFIFDTDGNMRSIAAEVVEGQKNDRLDINYKREIRRGN